MLTHKALFRIWILFKLCSFSLWAEAINENNIPKPEFFGIYAVVANKLIELKKGVNSDTFTTNSEFIYYGLDPKAAYQIVLQRLPSAAKQAERKRRLDAANGSSTVRGLAAALNENVESLSATLAGMVVDAVAVELKLKPLKSEANIIRLVPSVTLTPGDYQIGFSGVPFDECARFHIPGLVPEDESPNLPLGPGPVSGDAKNLYFQKTSATGNDIAPIDAQLIASSEETAPLIIRLINQSDAKITLVAVNSISVQGKSIRSQLTVPLAPKGTHDLKVSVGSIKIGDSMQLFCNGYSLPAQFVISQK